MFLNLVNVVTAAGNTERRFCPMYIAGHERGNNREKEIRQRCEGVEFCWQGMERVLRHVQVDDVRAVVLQSEV